MDRIDFEASKALLAELHASADGLLRKLAAIESKLGQISEAWANALPPLDDLQDYDKAIGGIAPSLKEAGEAWSELPPLDDLMEYSITASDIAAAFEHAGEARREPLNRDEAQDSEMAGFIASATERLMTQSPSVTTRAS